MSAWRRASDWVQAPAMRVAIGALAVAMAVAMWSIVGALRAPEPAPAPAPRVLVIPQMAPFGASRIARVVLDDDPFSPDRAPPPRRYRIPGTREADAAAGPGSSPPAVLGTVVTTGAGDRSFATLQIGEEAPRIAFVGDTVGSFTVRAIDRAHVGFSDRSGRHVDVFADSPTSRK